MTIEADILERAAWSEAARLVIRDHGADAVRHAAARVDELRSRGLLAGADAWQRILDTIERIQAAAGHPRR